MANSLFKGLAITLGGGLAVGLGIKIGQGSVPPPPPQEMDFGPVLDRIEGVENRIVTVESAHAALAALNEPGPMVVPTVLELEERVLAHGSEVEALRAAIQRATEQHEARIEDLGHAVNNLETRLPELIDNSIKPKFEELHERVQREMQETASQTLETFADRIQARVVEKITAIEGDLNRQSEAINDLRDYSLKTDQNLQRLLAGVETLADKINRKFETPVEPPRAAPGQRPSPLSGAPPPPSAAGVSVASPTPSAQEQESFAAMPLAGATPTAAKPDSVTGLAANGKATEFSSKIEVDEPVDARPPRETFPASGPKSVSGPEYEDLLKDPPRGNGFRRAAFVGTGVVLLATIVGGIELSGILQKPTSAHAASNNAAGSATAGGDALDTKKLTDQSELLDQARAFTQKKEFGKAEEVYRSILKNDPANTEVKRLLASALFRQEKIDESVKVLNSISEDKQATNEAAK